LAVADLVANIAEGTEACSWIATAAEGAGGCSWIANSVAGADGGSRVAAVSVVATDSEPPQAATKENNTKTPATRAGNAFSETVVNSLQNFAKIFNLPVHS